MDNAFAGRLRFHGGGGGGSNNGTVATNAKSTATGERPFICVNANVDVVMLAGFVVNTWQVPSPDVIITVCSGLRSSSALNKESHRYALQRGFTKLFSTANAWIFTHGCHAGIATLIGEAVKQEQERRSHIVLRKANVAQRKFYNKKLPKIVLFGVPTLRTLRDASCFTEPRPSPVPPPFSSNNVDILPQQQQVILDYTVGSSRNAAHNKQDLDPFHTHFIVVNDLNTNDDTSKHFVRGHLEQELHLYAQDHKAAAVAAADKSGVLSDSSADDEDSEPAESLPAIDESDTTSQQQQQAATAAAATVRDTRIPVVALVVQGGVEQLEQIIFYLHSAIPCVVIKGSGLMADILAAVYEDLFLEGASSFDDADMQALRADTTSRLKRHFGSGELASRKSLDACFDKISQIMHLANQHGRKFLSIVNLKISSDFVDLDKFILKALFASQDIGAALLRKNPDLLRNDLLLTLKWNNQKVARSEIFQSDIIGQWSRLRTDSEIFDQALMLKKRENFVDLFLEQGFKVHKYLSHRKLLQLFRRAEDTEFFHSVVLQGIMNYTAGSRVHARFIMFELNPLIYQMTNLKEFINAYALTASTYGMGGKEDVATARRRALLALLVWAIMLNRYDLAVVLWKHCDHPIPTALFAARLFTKMSEMCSEPELTEKLYSNGNKFGQMAIDILELGYVDGGALAFEVLETRFAEFGNKTVVVLAYEAENRYFLAHPCCQKWLNRLYQGRIDVQRHNLGPLGQLIPDAVKIVLSAWFILPMFMWIRFPADYNTGATAGGALRQHSNKKLGTSAMLYGDDNKTDDDEDNSAADDQLALYGEPGKKPKRNTVTAAGNALRSTAFTAWDRVVQRPTGQMVKTTSDLIGRGIGVVTWRNRAQSTGGAASNGQAIKPLTGRGTEEDDIELGTVNGGGGAATVGRTKVISLTPLITGASSSGDSSSGPYENVEMSRHSCTKNLRAAPGSGAGSSAGLLMTEHERREHELAKLAEEQRRSRAQGLTKIRIFDEPLQTINKRVLRRGRKTAATSRVSLDPDEADEEEARIPLHRKIYYLWQAPVTKYWTNLFAYVFFLTIYSIAAFVPDCDVLHVDLHVGVPFLTRAFSLAIDAVVWLWTALYTLELALRTYRQYEMGVPFQLRRRLLEIGLLTVALIVYILIRSLTAVFHLFSPFTARVIMLLGLLYFYFRLILLFFPLSRELGPLLVRVRVMCTQALASFLKFLAPFMLAYMIIIQVVLYPDRQLSWLSLWQAVKRSIFSFFTTNLGELDETKDCSGKRFDDATARNRSSLFNSDGGSTGLFYSDDFSDSGGVNSTALSQHGYCITGAYTDPTCANSGFWTYFFMIQWLFIFKLVLMSMLYAFFTTYTLRITQESEQIWKYQRYQLVVDIATRSALPPPLSIISHLVWLGYSVGLGAVSCMTACWRCCCCCWCCTKKRENDDSNSNSPLPPPASWSGTNSNRSSRASASYWQAMAQQFWRDRETEEMEKSKPEKQYSTILALKEDVDMARSSIRRMRNKLMVQDKTLTNVAQLMSNLSSAAATAAAPATTAPATTAPRPASAPHANQSVAAVSPINSTAL